MVERQDRLLGRFGGPLAPVLRLVGVVCLLLVLPLCLWQVPIVQHGLVLMRGWAGRPYAVFWVLPLAVLYCAFGLPRQALCVALGAGFGIVLGGLEASLAYGGGALLAYGWGRLYVRVRPGRPRPIPEFVQVGLEAPFRTILGLRLLPVGSALLVSVWAGMIRLAVARFFLATMLGGLPQTVIFILLGSGVRLGHGVALGAAIGLASLSMLLGVWVMQYFRKVIRERTG